MDDLAAQLKIRRRDLNIASQEIPSGHIRPQAELQFQTAAAKGLVFGHLTFKMSSGEMIDCASNPAVRPSDALVLNNANAIQRAL